MNHGWQSESTDGPTGGWSCVFFLSGCNGCNGCSGHVTTTAGCSVVWRSCSCSCSCSCSVVECSGAVAVMQCN